MKKVRGHTRHSYITWGFVPCTAFARGSVLFAIFDLNLHMAVNFLSLSSKTLIAMKESLSFDLATALCHNNNTKNSLAYNKTKHMKYPFPSFIYIYICTHTIGE